MPPVSTVREVIPQPDTGRAGCWLPFPTGVLARVRVNDRQAARRYSLARAQGAEPPTRGPRATPVSHSALSVHQPFLFCPPRRSRHDDATDADAPDAERHR